MARAGTLTVKIVGDASNFERTMGKVQGGLGKFASGAAKYGKVAAVGVGAAATGAAVLGNEVLNTGAKLTAWRLKTKTVFENSADDVRKWADQNNEAFGVTDDELAGLAASFGDLLKPMGFTAKEAATMSKDVVGLSGALSEWSGGQRSAAEVSDILAKAMLGERESLKELGISITEYEVQARLAAKGQDELTGAARQQAMAIATQELIMEKSVDAQKAYAAGGNEALRAQNSLKAGVAELREQLADRLLPIVTQVTQWMADNLPAALDRAGQIAADLKERWDQIFPALKAIVETFVNVVTVLWDTFGRTLLERTTAMLSRVRDFIAAALEVIRGIFNAFAGLFTGDWGRMWDGIRQALGGIWEAIKAIVGAGLDHIKFVLGVAMGAVKEVWSAAWNALKDIVIGGVQFIVDSFLGMVESIVGAAETAFGWVPGVGDKLRDAERAVAAFRDNVNRELDSIRNRDIVVTITGRWNIPQPPSGIRGGGLAGVFHSGGTVHAGRPGGEALVLARDGERFSTPTEDLARGGGYTRLHPDDLAALASILRRTSRAA